MRFIVGLVFGAAVSLLGAVFIEQPQPVNSVAPVTQATKTPKASNDRAKEQLAANTTRPAAALPETAVTPPKPTPKPESIVEDAKPVAKVTAKASAPDKSTSTAQTSSGALVGEQPPISSELLPVATGKTPLQQVAVWSPFHSEASAQGFAARLTQQVEHPFRVNKLGPARYAVVYEFADAEQQALLAEKIAVATGATGATGANRP